MKTVKDIYYYLANECISGKYRRTASSVSFQMERIAVNMILRGEY